MRKPLLKALIIFSLILTVFTACDHNVYMGEPERITPSLWKVNNTYFDSLQEAMDYIYGNTKGNSKSKSITDIPLSRTAILQRDVLHSNGETGGGLVVPEDFTGQLVIDFNGFTYEFDNSLDHFFDVRGGDEVYIFNGTTVIYNEADHEPYALAVNTDTVTIDDHLIDDRRWDPTNNKSDAKLFDVGPEGSLVVTNISSSETGATLSGVIAIATDGIENGGKIRITNSELVITNIFTTYQDSEGNIQPAIPSTVVVPEAAKSVIDILSGTVEIQDINQGTDYKDGSSLFIKAILNIIKGDPEDPTRETLVTNPHKIDIIIEAIVNLVTDPTKQADKEIIHDLYDDWSTDNPGYPATCTESGLEVRWCHFDDCDVGGGVKYHQERVIPALGHNLTHHDAVAATCTTDGNIEYWHCDRCLKYFADEACTDEKTEEQLIIHALGHDMSHVEKVEPDCETTGIVEHYHCSRCGLNFTDQEGSTEIDDIVIPALGHDMSHVEAVAPTCTEDGILAHYHCSRCTKDFEDEAGKHEMSTVVDPALGHNLTHHAAVAATCTTDGNIEYWHCARCLKYFADEVCTQEKTAEQVVIPALGHDWSTVWSTDGTYHWHVCKRPGCSAVNDKAEHTILYTYSYEDEILDVERKCSVCEFIKIDEIEDEDGVFRMDIFADPGLSVTTTEESGINIIQVSIVNTSGISNIHWYNNADGQIVDYLEGLTSFKVKGTGHYAFYCKYKDELKITRTLLVQFKKRM